MKGCLVKLKVRALEGTSRASPQLAGRLSPGCASLTLSFHVQHTIKYLGI